MKLDELLEQDARSEIDEARELHDALARSLTAQGRPHPLWDDCDDEHREKIKRIIASGRGARP